MAARAGRQRAATVLWVCLISAWLWKVGGGAQDDFFITFTYARNLAEGQGFVFNAGERVFGLTNPGLALLLALVHLLTRAPIPVLANVLSGLALLGLALLLLREAAERGRAAEAAAGGTLVVASSFLWANAGGEWPLMLALLLGAATLSPRWPVVSGLLAGLAVWFRPEAVLAVGLLGVLIWLAERRLPWRFAAASAGVVLAGLAAAWLWFGTIIPNTLAGKRAMALGEAVPWSGWTFWLRMAPMAGRHFGPAWPLLALLGAAGLGVWWRRAGRGGRLLIAYGLTLAVFYPLSGVQFFSWYVAPCVVILLVGAASAVGALLRAAKGRAGRVLVGAAALALFIAVVPSGWRWYRSFTVDPRLDTYKDAARWLAENTPPDARVAYVEIGVLGFYSRRSIQDLMGLVSPEVLPHVARGDMVGAFLARPTDYVLFHTRGRMGAIVSSPWFPGAYREVAFFPEEGPSGERRGLTVYRRRAGGKIPPRP